MRTPRLLLNDILDAIAVIEQYTPATSDAFEADPPVQSHIVRHIAIIGEAASRLPQSFRDEHGMVPWRAIIDMRNIVIHVYHGINWQRVYETAQNDVPPLKHQIESILASLPPEP